MTYTPTRALQDAAPDLARMERPERLGRNVLPSGNVYGLKAPRLLIAGEEHALAVDYTGWGEGEGTSPRGLLGAFMTLSDAAGVAEFAGEYGPLGLCRFWEPLDGNESNVPRALRFTPHDHERCWEWADADTAVRREPIQMWLELARAVRSRVELFHHARTGARELVTPELLKAAFPNMVFGFPAAQVAEGFMRGSEWPAMLRDLLSLSLEQMIQTWLVLPSFEWERGLVLGTRTRDFIPLQLATLFAEGGQALCICDSCHLAYFRQRAAPSGLAKNHNYCPSCRAKGADLRDQARRRRARRRAERLGASE